MGFWADASSDLTTILDDLSGPSGMVTHTPAAGGQSSVFPAMVIGQGRTDDDKAYKVTANIYFSRLDLATPVYQDTLTDAAGNVWKLIMDTGSNGDLMIWFAERDTRTTLGKRAA